jgi:hypothetical protein
MIRCVTNNRHEIYGRAELAIGRLASRRSSRLVAF